MSSTTTIRALLTTAQREQTHITVRFAFGNRETIDGFVVGRGRKWALLAATMTGGFFDGYAAVRLAEIERVRPNRFWEARFSRTRPEWPPRPPADRPAIDLDTTSGLLATFLDPDTLVSIERRKKYSAMWVGVPSALTRNWLSLWEVDATAVWHERPLGYRPRTIALVRIGDHYLRGLSAVVGDRPPQDLPYDWAARSKHARRQPRRRAADGRSAVPFQDSDDGSTRR